MRKLRIIDESQFEKVDKNWSIYQISKKFPPNSWEKVFKESKNELKEISKILKDHEEKYGEFYPLKSDIFRPFFLTSLENIKVVIIDQEPYCQSVYLNGKNLPKSVGMAYSIRKEDTSIPSSLQNIYIELSNTVKGFKIPSHGDLSSWAYQGVLLLNTCLTVRQGKKGSHGEFWLGFIHRVFKAISEINPYCIFLLWGKEAQKITPMIGEKSIILEASHPEGYNAKKGFFGCNHFNEVNKILIKQKKTEINWILKSKEPYDATKSFDISKKIIMSTLNNSPPISTNISKPIIPFIMFGKNN